MIQRDTRDNSIKRNLDGEILTLRYRPHFNMEGVINESGVIIKVLTVDNADMLFTEQTNLYKDNLVVTDNAIDFSNGGTLTTRKIIPKIGLNDFCIDIKLRRFGFTGHGRVFYISNYNGIGGYNLTFIYELLSNGTARIGYTAEGGSLAYLPLPQIGDLYDGNIHTIQLRRTNGILYYYTDVSTPYSTAFAYDLVGSTNSTLVFGMFNDSNISYAYIGSISEFSLKIRNTDIA